MKPLFSIVVAILVIAANAHPENIEDVKQLTQSKEPVLEAEESEPQARQERCTACSSTLTLKSPKDILAKIQALPNSEVHTQQSFEECSSEKGCAGIKLKDGQVVQKFGNLEAFKAAASADTGNEFQFQAAGNSVFDANVAGGGPFWWMNQNSPFKNAGAAGSGGFEKFSKTSSSSSFTSTGNGAAGGLDIGANPFLNGDISKLSGGFGGSGGNFATQTFESSSSTKEVDISKNPFLNGGIQTGLAGAGFGAQGGAFGSNSQSNFGSSQSAFGAGSQNGFGAQGGFGGAQGQAGLGSGQSSQSSFNAYNSASKFGSGYTGSSPAPFAPPTGANVNLIQNSQKNEYDFEQQQQTQQNIDEIFQSTGNVQAADAGGDLQQTCAGQGYVCVPRAQCNNGVVNTNGGSLLQANTQKQYCNLRSEVCCRIETSSLAGAGSLQGSLGVGSATFQGQSSQGSGLFSQSGSGQSSQNFGATGFGSSQSTNTASAFNRGQSSGFGNTNQFGTGSGVSSSSYGNRGSTTSSGFGTTLAPSNNRFGAGGFNNEVFKQTSQSNFVETDTFSSGSENTGVFRPGASGSGLKPGIPYLPPLDATSSGTNVVSTAFPTPTFVTTPRPFTPRPVTPRPFTTPKPTYLPPVPSTSAPEYLPPIDHITGSESRQPDNPQYVDGSLILDQNILPNRPVPRPRPAVPVNTDIPAGCAAALKCTPIEFCTAEGVISNTTIALTRDQEAFRVPLTDCKDLETGRIGKCCRDPTYTDPWPVNQLGKWTPGVFGGNDGQYVPDSRGSPNNPRPNTVTALPPVTGGVILSNTIRPTPKPSLPQGPNQITPGFPTATVSPGFVQKTQFGQGSYSQGGRGQIGVGSQGGVSQFGQGSSFSQTTSSFGQGSAGQTVSQGQGSYSQGGRGQLEVVGQGVGVSQGVGQGVRQGSGVTVNRGQGFGVTQGFGTGIRTQGQGSSVLTGQGVGVTQGQGFGVSQGQGSTVSQGSGFGVSQGAGFGVSQGQGVGISRGQGFAVTQGQGQGQRVGQGFAVTQGQGSSTSQGFGVGVSQGSGSGIRQGSGFGISQGGGAGVSQGAGFGVSQGSGFGVSQGQGSGIRQGVGFGVTQGGGAGLSQGGGFGISQGQGNGFQQGLGFGVVRETGQTLFQGQGQALVQGKGEEVSQGFGTGVSRGQSYTVSQGGGFGVENEYGESVHRVFLTRYSGSGQCGIPNPQKPLGNRKDLEVDFAEIPWQAMVLLQTNRSLLCGGIITRPDVVITSAACVEGLQAKNVLIKGGEWKLGIDEEPLPFQIVQVKTILRHPFYKKGSLKNDAAILILSENLRLAKNIWPICLPSSKDESLDAYYNGAGECIVTGWGKNVLQAHLLGSVMNSVNVSLLNPGECESKISQDYPHLLEQYDQSSCVCGQPTNPVNNICKVDTGSALACTTGDNHYVLRGIYSFESGCQAGNQLAAFYKFDLEWYEWAIGLIESVRFAQYSTTKITKNKIISQVSGVKSSAYGSGVKGGQVSGVKGSGGSSASAIAVSGGVKGFGVQGQSQSGQYSQFGSTKFSESGESGVNFNTDVKGPISNTFSATYTEKKFFQTEPKIVTYTTKPEIVTFTTKPEYFTFTTEPKYYTYTTKPEIVTYTTKPEIVTYTTKPEIIRYTTKPQIIRYETSGSQTNSQYVSPSVSFNPSFSEVVGAKHTHNAQCKCLENGKK